MNLEYACRLIQTLIDWGVAEFYVCGGARNVPLVEAIASIKSNRRIAFNHFDERSAAFFALGRVKSLGKPVCVVVTSGTAAGELLPATMEAFYSGLPLVLLTADRPERYRGTGAPQAAEQQGLFGSYVSKCIDLTDYQEVNLAALPYNRPLHINVCFDVPLNSGQIVPINYKPASATVQNVMSDPDQLKLSRATITEFIRNAKAPLVILSKIPEDSRSAVVSFLKELSIPVYSESLSNLREAPELNNCRVHCADKIWSNSKMANYPIDAVLKIGQTPTQRLWRDLDETRQDIKVLSVSNLEFSGTPQADHITCNLNDLFSAFKCVYSTSSTARTFLEYDRRSFENLKTVIAEHPLAEQSWFCHLSKRIPAQARIYLGNSLPIRDWDLAATFVQKNFQIEASRGLNGIDGQLSTFLGFAQSNRANWGILGDLTALYDFSGSWILDQLPDLKVNLVVINNQGGKIFDRLFKDGPTKDLIINSHSLNFEHFAKFWKFDYYRVDRPDQLGRDSNSSCLIEVLPDDSQSIAWTLAFNRNN